MRLTEGQLRRIIKEELSREYFGISDNIDEMVAELRELEHGSRRYNMQDVVGRMSDVGKRYGMDVTYIASGTARFALALGSDLILKVARSSSSDPSVSPKGAKRMNHDDYKLGTDPSLGGAFVRAYDHAPDWSWILLEKVQVIHDNESFVKLFPNELLPSLEEVRSSDSIDRKISMFPEMLYVDVIQAFLSPDPAREISSWPPLGRNLLAVMRIKNPSLPEIGEDEVRAILAAYNRHRGFRSIRKAVIKHGVASVEIRSDNVGVTPGGDVVLIDSSMPPN